MIDLAPDVSRFKVGDRVHLPLRHRQTHTFDENVETLLGPVTPLPDGFSPELVTHRIPFEKAADAYQLIESQPEDVIKVILTY